MDETKVRTRIVLVHEQRMVREGLRASLEQYADLEVVGESAGDMGSPQGDLPSADVAIVDVAHISRNPIVILEYVRRGWPQIRVIALAAVPNRVHLTGLFRAGIRGYVTLQSALEDLLEAVRTVVSGSTYVCSQATQVLLDEFARGGADQEEARQSPLTDREATILEWLAEGRTSKEIGVALGLSSKTIDACRRRLMQKLEVDSLAGLVKCALVREATLPVPLAAK